ncbi:hypothetical protein [Nocardiopsis listeri]|nr:hypothetical protein [Nocardiopsis listeri]
MTSFTARNVEARALFGDRLRPRRRSLLLRSPGVLQARMSNSKEWVW